MTKMKLQEISRKMLAKRRKISCDTQTDNPKTLRVKDASTSSIAEQQKKVQLKDASVLTEDHVDCLSEVSSSSGSKVLRLKECSTLTDKERPEIVHVKDAESVTDNFDASSLFWLGDENPSIDELEPKTLSEKSTNTLLKKSIGTKSSSTSQTDSDDTRIRPPKPSAPVLEEERNVINHHCHLPCGKSENSEISISLGNMNITIRTPDILESKITVGDDQSAGSRGDDQQVATSECSSNQVALFDNNSSFDVMRRSPRCQKRLTSLLRHLLLRSMTKRRLRRTAKQQLPSSSVIEEEKLIVHTPSSSNYNNCTSDSCDSEMVTYFHSVNAIHVRSVNLDDSQSSDDRKSLEKSVREIKHDWRRSVEPPRKFTFLERGSTSLQRSLSPVNVAESRTRVIDDQNVVQCVSHYFNSDQSNYLRVRKYLKLYSSDNYSESL